MSCLVSFSGTVTYLLYLSVTGGVIELTAVNLLIDGNLKVNGGNSFGVRGGGGAAGSVYIQVLTNLTKI